MRRCGSIALTAASSRPNVRQFYIRPFCVTCFGYSLSSFSLTLTWTHLLLRTLSTSRRLSLTPFPRESTHACKINSREDRVMHVVSLLFNHHTNLDSSKYVIGSARNWSTSVRTEFPGRQALESLYDGIFSSVVLVQHLLQYRHVYARNMCLLRGLLS